MTTGRVRIGDTGTKSVCATVLLSIAVLSTAACGAQGATRPPMTAQEHEALASAGGEQATAHRQAAQAIREAEEQACAGVPVAERDAGPFTRHGRVVAVKPLVEAVPIGKQTYLRNRGSKVTILAIAGMTSQWLTRLAECHAARHASVGPGIDEGRPCPLSQGPVTISVVEAPTAFIMSIRAVGGEGDAERILRLSEGLRSSAEDPHAATTSLAAP